MWAAPLVIIAMERGAIRKLLLRSALLLSSLSFISLILVGETLTPGPIHHRGDWKFILVPEILRKVDRIASKRLLEIDRS